MGSDTEPDSKKGLNQQAFRSLLSSSTPAHNNKTPKLLGSKPNRNHHRNQPLITKKQDELGEINPYLLHTPGRNLNKSNVKKKEGGEWKGRNKKIETDSNYRDRAEERRQNEQLEEQNPSQQPNATPHPDQILDPLQEYQRSKFLGGDVEHTHLVKGLDYALLNKIRLEKNEKELIDKQIELELGDDVLENIANQQLLQPMTNNNNNNNTEAKPNTILGKSIISSLLDQPKEFDIGFNAKKYTYNFKLADKREYFNSFGRPTMVTKMLSELDDKIMDFNLELVLNKLNHLFQFKRDEIENKKSEQNLESNINEIKQIDENQQQEPEHGQQEQGQETVDNQENLSDGIFSDISQEYELDIDQEIVNQQKEADKRLELNLKRKLDRKDIPKKKVRFNDDIKIMEYTYPDESD